MSPPTAEEIVRRATAAFNAGQPDEARELCEKGLGQKPGDPMLSHLLAAVLFSNGETKDARAHIETSLAKRPDNAPALLLAARIARAAADFDAALKHLDRAIARAPQRDLFLEKARTLDQAGLAPQAREAWRAILKAIPQHQEATARLGRLAWEDGDHAAAVSLLERAAAGDAPASVWFNLGLARQDLRDSFWFRCGLSQGDRDQARPCPSRAESRRGAAGKRRPRQCDVRLCASLSAAAFQLRPDRAGARIGLARPFLAGRGVAAPLTRRLNAVERPRRARNRFR